MTTTCNGCWHLGEACGHCDVCSGPPPFPACGLRSLRWAWLAGAAVLAGLAGCATSADAARCRDTRGRFIKCPAPAPTPAPAPAPMPMPPTTATEPVVSPNGLGGEVDVADGLDVNASLEPGEAPHESPDAEGAFRFWCTAGQISKDDPIVYPGQPGASHAHQFLGNTGTNAGSTYQSLRTTGGSTCTQSSAASVQRTAYWEPAMQVDDPIAPYYIKPYRYLTYYKLLPASDPKCALTVDPVNPAIAGPPIGKCVPVPNGLRFIFGRNMAAKTGGPNDPNSRDYESMGFDCGDINNESIIGGTKHTMKAVLDTGKCPAGSILRVFGTFASCWDGKNLDTADHRSHIIAAPQAICDFNHPYRIPAIAVSAFFLTDANWAKGLWHLSCDAGLVAGECLHFDYWEAWNPAIKALWHGNCIDKHLTCSNGNVGDGRQIKGMTGTASGSLVVPLTSIP